LLEKIYIEIFYLNTMFDKNFLVNLCVNGDWGLGIGDWGLGPIPNPQSPIPNPQNQLHSYSIKNIN
jgi:hypothetical protein